MPDDFPYLRDGDELTPRHFNLIYDELRRWRKLSAAPPLAVDNADGDAPPVLSLVEQRPFFAVLTGGYVPGPPAGYPWQEVLIGPGRAVQNGPMVGTAANGALAVERQTGDTTLTADGTVYELRWSPGGGLSFDGKN